MHTKWMSAALTLGLLVGSAACADEAVDKALESLKSYDWGSDRAALQPIEAAVAATKGDAAARKTLEARLADVLKSDAPQAAKDFVCRQLSLIGTAESVPALATLLADEKLSHMARYALERISDDAAVQALREALPKSEGLRKVGVLHSLGARRDAQSVAALVPLLGDSDAQVAKAAVHALGAIGTADSAKALGDYQPKSPEALRLAVADACLACAEHLLADGKRTEAIAIYKALGSEEQPTHVQVAARRGLLAAMRQK